MSANTRRAAGATIAAAITALAVASSAAAGFDPGTGGGPSGRSQAQDLYLIPGGGLNVDNPKRAVPWGGSGNVWQTATRNTACRYLPATAQIRCTTGSPWSCGDARSSRATAPCACPGRPGAAVGPVPEAGHVPVHLAQGLPAVLQPRHQERVRAEQGGLLPLESATVEPAGGGRRRLAAPLRGLTDPRAGAADGDPATSKEER
jgi:hypothetical protein